MIRVGEVFLMSLVVSVVASLTVAVAANLWDESWMAAVPWGVLTGCGIGAILAVVQHVTGFTYLDESESP